MAIMIQPLTARSTRRRNGPFRFRKFCAENGLSIVMFGLFFGCWISLFLVGWHAYNGDRQDHHLSPIAISSYAHSGHFWEATMENWEGEFLPMAIFIWLTSHLTQKGSPESKEPHKKTSDGRVTSRSPWPVRAGGVIRKIYENSLSLSLFIAFIACFFLHAASGACAYSDQQRMIGQASVTTWQYLAEPQFWFQSFQNWQSEFMSNAVMIVLAIYLRQKGSPESKQVASSNSKNK